jgi:hypothetical protein
MDLISDKIKVKDLLVLKRSNMLTVNPKYHRGAVWSEAQQKRLVDSVMRCYPLPLIYLLYKKVTVAGMSREVWSQQNLPATIKYPEIVAEIFPYFTHDKLPGHGKESLWFL